MNSISQTRNTHKKTPIKPAWRQKQVTFLYFSAHEILYLWAHVWIYNEVMSACHTICIYINWYAFIYPFFGGAGG